MSFNVYNMVSQPETHTYKLMQLPKELLEYMKEADRPLQFKSSSAENCLVLCTDASTYNVRQMKHSNTQLLLNDLAINGLESSLKPISTPSGEQSQSLVAVGSSSYQYELSKTHGHVDTSGLPVYNGSDDPSPQSKAVQDVLRDSPIADGAFHKAWYAINGSEVQGKAVILSPGFVTDVLYVLISILAQENATEFLLDEIHSKVEAHNKKYTLPIVTTVAHRFCTQSGSQFQIESESVATWFGSETLRNLSGDVSDKDFLIEWKSSLPPLFNASLDLKALRGRFYRPMVGKVKYINASLLSSDLHTRVKELFKIVNVWDYDEFLPLVNDLLPANKKPDAVILKYARKKREGKKFVVCPR